jgi:hypothetical protein
MYYKCARCLHPVKNAMQPWTLPHIAHVLVLGTTGCYMGMFLKNKIHNTSHTGILLSYGLTWIVNAQCHIPLELVLADKAGYFWIHSARRWISVSHIHGLLVMLYIYWYLVLPYWPPEQLLTARSIEQSQAARLRFPALQEHNTVNIHPVLCLISVENP